MFTLYRVDFALFQMGNTGNICIVGFSLFSSPHFPKMMTGTLSLESVGWRIGYVGLHSDQIWTKLS